MVVIALDYDVNDRIVKDAYILFRYSHEGYHVNLKRYEHTAEQEVARLSGHVGDWFLIDYGDRFAGEELKSREKECKI